MKFQVNVFSCKGFSQLKLATSLTFLLFSIKQILKNTIKACLSVNDMYKYLLCCRGIDLKDQEILG